MYGNTQGVKPEKKNPEMLNFTQLLISKIIFSSKFLFKSDSLPDKTMTVGSSLKSNSLLYLLVLLLPVRLNPFHEFEGNIRVWVEEGTHANGEFLLRRAQLAGRVPPAGRQRGLGD